MASENLLEPLVRKLQNTAEDEDIAIVQAMYHQLKAAFAHELFDLKNAPQDHYAWLLINQDAGYLLDRLLLSHKMWHITKDNPALWGTYREELADFKWVITMAMMCKP